MASGGRPLPKFGEWDVNNPASAEGFTVIFNKARDEKKIKNGPVRIVTPRPEEVSVPINKKEDSHHNPKRKWLCCG